MRITRIYEPQALTSGATIALAEQNAAHLCKVLRLQEGAPLQVFDGHGHEFKAILVKSGKNAAIALQEEIINTRESPLVTILGQVISRGDKMDFTIQKAVELGIHAIYPLSSARCGVKLDVKRMERKLDAWQKIAAGACEQCGRAVVPTVHPLMDLANFCSYAQDAFDLRLTLDPTASVRLRDLNAHGSICLLIGPEGGFAPEETTLATEHAFTGVSLGPRILRTETAALTALSILGSHFGDL